MTWMLRHAGSPRHVEGLSSTQVIDALREGGFDTTDEIRGVADCWVAIEQHPEFADIVEDLTPETMQQDEGETHLDMNALIDVTLVLLIFFILTTSYQVLEKVLEMPKIKSSDASGVRTVRAEDAETFMISVKVRQEQGVVKLWVGDQLVDEANLPEEIRRQAGQTRKELILDAADVDYGVVIKIIDAAGGAGIDKVHFLVTKG